MPFLDLLRREKKRKILVENENREPVNKNAEKQLRFEFSKKKRTDTKSALKAPIYE